MAIPLKIGNYQLLKTLGNGTFGKVKLGVNEITGQKVAVKIMNRKKIRQMGMFDKLKREIKILKLFSHPHIIKIYEFIETPSDIFVILEYASGGELFDLISRNEMLEENLARKLFQQLISGLDYAHQHKVTHRDLKPENLLFDSDQNLKIGDFGLCNIMKDGVFLKTSCGSPNYASPEVISGSFYDGKEVDVWSSGVILYAMLCGSLPFDEDQMQNLFGRIRSAKFQLPNFVSLEARDLINQLLQPLPLKRIKISQIKGHPWFHVHVPYYLEILLNKNFFKKNDKNPFFTALNKDQLDEEIVHKLFKLNLNLDYENLDEIKKSIRQRRNVDFCVIYDFLFHQKFLDRCFKKEMNPRKLFSIRKKSSNVYTMEGMFDEQNEEKQSPEKEETVGLIQKRLGAAHYSRLNRIKSKFRKPLKTLDQIDSKMCESSQTISSWDQSTFYSQAPSPKEDSDQRPTFDCVKQALLRKIPKKTFLIIKGQPVDIVKALCKALKALKFEWQFFTKEMKMKCRTRFLEQDFLNQSSDFDVDLFLQKSFLKFQIQLFKWSKEFGDYFVVDFFLIKAGSPNAYLDNLNSILALTANEVLGMPTLQLVKSIGVGKELNPSRGHGFELVPLQRVRKQSGAQSQDYKALEEKGARMLQSGEDILCGSC